MAYLAREKLSAKERTCSIPTGTEQVEKLRAGLLDRSQRLLVNRRPAMFRGFERIGRTYRLAALIGHSDVIGGVGLQVGESRTMIVSAGGLDSAYRSLLQIVAVSVVVQVQVSALFGGPGYFC